MIKKTLASLLALVVISAISGTGAQAAGITSSATAGGLCVQAGTVTPINGKSYTCVKVLSGKMIWSLPATSITPKPKITGVAKGEGGVEGSDHKGGLDVAQKAVLKKYNACLVAHGGTALLAPVVVKKSDDRKKPSTKPTVKSTATPTATPTITPTVSDAQKAAITACATLAPKPRVSGGSDD
jgi:hypothetical protein